MLGLADAVSNVGEDAAVPSPKEPEGIAAGCSAAVRGLTWVRPMYTLSDLRQNFGELLNRAEDSRAYRTARDGKLLTIPSSVARW